MAALESFAGETDITNTRLIVQTRFDAVYWVVTFNDWNSESGVMLPSVPSNARLVMIAAVTWATAQSFGSAPATFEDSDFSDEKLKKG